MPKSKLQFWTLEILLLLLIIFVCTKVTFLFHPIISFTTTLFLPMLAAGILFFIFSPVVKFLEKNRIPRTLSILIIYLVFIGLFILLFALVGPLLSQQVQDLFKSVPAYTIQISQYIESLSHSKWFTWVMTQEYVSMEKIRQALTDFSTSLPQNITSSLTQLLSVVTNITLTVITVPFILFYMLKDGHKFPGMAVKVLPVVYRKEGLKIFADLYNTLAAYIQGQLIICIFVGTGCFIGFSLIGLNYALILGLTVAVANIIPYLGPFIGATPAVIIGLLESPTKALLAAVVVTVVQQIDGNLVSPLIIGKRLNTHPLTIILLLIGAGSFGGILGMILAVPTYAVLKAVFLNVVRLVRLRMRYQNENKGK